MAIRVGQRRDTLGDSTLRTYRAKADRRLDALVLMDTATPAGAELQRHARRWRSQLFTFLTDRDVNPTKNAAEWALRPSVIFRKVINGFRSMWGADLMLGMRAPVPGQLRTWRHEDAFDDAMVKAIAFPLTNATHPTLAQKLQALATQCVAPQSVGVRFIRHV